MPTLVTLELFALNLAITSTLCFVIAVASNFCFQSLPKRLGTLSVGLFASLLAPLLVTLGMWLSCGVLPSPQFASNVGDGARAETLLPSTSLATIQNMQTEQSAAGRVGTQTLLPLAYAKTDVPSHSQSLPQAVNMGSISSLGSTPTASQETRVDGPRVPIASFWWLELAFVVVWCIGSAIVFARTAMAIFVCRRFRCTCRPAQSQSLRKMYRSVCQRIGCSELPLFESDRLPAPVVMGWLSPVVVVPSDIERVLTVEQLCGIFAHELSHIRRRDHWVAAAQAFSAILYWWNPLLIWVHRLSSTLREMVCDDVATSSIQSGVPALDPRLYAKSLVAMAQRTIGSQAMTSPSSMGLSSLSEMEVRMGRILAASSTKVIELKLTRSFAGSLTLFLLLLAAALPFAQIGTPQAFSATSPSTQPSDEAAELADDSGDLKLGKPEQKPIVFRGTVVDMSDAPAAGAVLQLKNQHLEIDVEIRTGTNGDFEIPLRVDHELISNTQVLARSGDGSQLAMYRFPALEGVEDVHAAKIQLEPLYNARVKVVDEKDVPISGALVAIQLNYPHVAGPAFTDDSGEVVIPLPDSEKILSAVAWKDDKGLDYKLYTLPSEQSADRLTAEPKFPRDSQEQLILDGAAPLSVRTTDSQGIPAAGIESHVWLLQKDTQADQINLSYFGDSMIKKSGNNGEVLFSWFPRWQKQPVTIWSTGEGFLQTRSSYDPLTKSNKVDVQLDRTIPMGGKVTFPDGRPAAGIAVQAIGAGYSFDSHRAAATTDSDGRYSIMLAPNQIYMLVVGGGQWAAPAQSGFAVLPGQAVPDHDFVLKRSTRIFGKVLNQKNKTPLKGQHVFLQQLGVELSAMGDNVLPNPKKSNKWVCPVWQQGASSDAEGAFEFFVAEGNYNLFVLGYDGEEILVAQEDELNVDLTLPIEEKQLLTGLVINDKTGLPEPGSNLESVSRNFRLTDGDWKAKASDGGKFQVERLPEATMVHAVSADSLRGAIQEIEAEQTSVVLRVAELGSATGRLLTEDGQGPAPGVRLYYGVKVTDKEGTMFSSRFGKVITTDEDGRFELTGLVPGWQYECTLLEHPSGYVLNVAKVTVEPGASVALEDARMPTPPKPYVPPTLEEQTQAAFKEPGGALQRFESYKKLLNDLQQNMLIVFGDPSNERTKSFMELQFDRAEFRPYYDDFRTVAFSTQAEHLEDANALARALEMPAELQASDFAIAIVNHAGSIVARIAANDICDGEKISKERLFALLDQHKTPPLDARQLLDEALATAKRENKCVIVQETATWCGPCYSLSRLLKANRQWEKDYVWVKMDHRWTGASQIMKELRGDAQGGIPWFVILDEDGNKLITSNHFKSGQNIGFPAEPEAQEHFAKMFLSTRSRMTDQEVADLVSAAKSQ